VLATFAVVAPVDEIAAAVRARCDGVVDRAMPAFPPGIAGQVVAGVLERLRQEFSSAARR
jgi:hypothetical protein